MRRRKIKIRTSVSLSFSSCHLPPPLFSSVYYSFLLCFLVSCLFPPSSQIFSSSFLLHPLCLRSSGSYHSFLLPLSALLFLLIPVFPFFILLISLLYLLFPVWPPHIRSLFHWNYILPLGLIQEGFSVLLCQTRFNRTEFPPVHEHVHLDENPSLTQSRLLKFLQKASEVKCAANGPDVEVSAPETLNINSAANDESMRDKQGTVDMKIYNPSSFCPIDTTLPRHLLLLLASPSLSFLVSSYFIFPSLCLIPVSCLWLFVLGAVLLLKTSHSG